MKLFALCLAALLVIAPALAEAGTAEDIDLSALEEYSREAGLADARSLLERVLRGEVSLDSLDGRKLAKRLVRGMRSAFAELLGAVALPVLACLALRVFPGRRKDWGRAAELVCRIACVLALFGRYRSSAQRAGETLGRASGFVSAAAPALASALALSGSPASAMLAPGSAICMDWVESLLRDCGLPLCAVAAVVAAAESLSDRFRLDRLFDWLKKAVVWGTGALLAGFTGLMSLEGMLATAQETAANRVARQAISGLVPIIGGSMSEAASSLAAGIAAIRGAVGVTGALLLLSSCCGPLLRLSVGAASVKLAAAVFEPVAQRSVSQTLSRFGDLLEMLLAIGIGGVALALLLIGACLSAAGAAL